MSERKRAFRDMNCSSSKQSIDGTNNNTSEEEDKPVIQGLHVVENANHNRCKPNKFLTEEEKKEKRRLKKTLKVKQKINSLETRIRHAIKRNDPVVEQQSRLELEALCTKTNESHFLDNASQSASGSDQRKEHMTAKKILIEIGKKLYQTFSDEQLHNSNEDNYSKQHQTKCAVKLLKNMTKGNVDKSMFDDKSALLGYTRQKFYERAMLLFKTMEKLRPTSDEEDMKLYGGALSHDKKEIKARIWDQVQCGRIQCICSIGCGPGNDCLGVLLFLSSLYDPNVNTKKFMNTVGCKRIIMTDWSIDQWASAVLTPLSLIIKDTDHFQEGKSENSLFVTSFSDVTKPFSDAINDQVRAAIEKIPCDMYLISYLLSETNGKWQSFFDGLIRTAKEGSLFYFAEPTPWQLHCVIDQFSEVLDFMWLDSSMCHPSLQNLERRTGPAVLFAIKKMLSKNCA